MKYEYEDVHMLFKKMAVETLDRFFRIHHKYALELREVM